MSVIQSPRRPNLIPLFVVLASLGMPGVSDAQCDNKLKNGSFESPAISDSYRHLPGGEVSHWDLTQGPSLEIQRINPKYGAQYVELASSGPTEVSQEIATIAGASYELRFAYRSRPGTQSADNAFEVRVNDETVMRLFAEGESPHDWKWRTIPVAGNGSPIRIAFRDVSQPGNGAGALIDNVQLCLTGQTASSAKGLTWRLVKTNAPSGTVRVGCGNDECDADNGDTPCTEALPILCIKKSGAGFPLPVPATVDNTDQYNKWSGGVIATTAPTQPPATLVQADALCAEQFGVDWRVAEHHDGWGWYFQAYGGVGDPDSRFWVDNNDRPNATCWN